MQKHWQLKAQAHGLWKEKGEKQKMSCLMMDKLRQIEKLQKEHQRSLITITDIEATKKLRSMCLINDTKKPCPGGFEEKV